MKGDSQIMARTRHWVGNHDLRALLVEHGGTLDGLSSMGTAFVAGGTRLVQKLLDKGANATTALHEAVMRPDFTQMIKLLLDRGADINARSKAGVPPLFAVAAVGNIAFVRLLLERGANALARDKNGKTLLFHSVGNKPSRDLVQLVLDQGVDVNARDNSGKTVLFQCSHVGGDILKLLLDRGADVDARDPNGNTPLHVLAANQAHTNSVRPLLASGQRTKRSAATKKTV